LSNVFDRKTAEEEISAPASTSSRIASGIRIDSPDHLLLPAAPPDNRHCDEGIPNSGHVAASHARK
jgi:hypothetical protein